MKSIILSLVIFSSVITANAIADEYNPNKSVVYIQCRLEYNDGKHENIGAGTGSIITNAGEILTAKHILGGDEIPSEAKRVCFGKLRSQRFSDGAGTKLTIDTTVSTGADVALLKFPSGTNDGYEALKVCNSRSMQDSRSVNYSLRALGYPLDVDLNSWDTKILSYEGPRSTWFVDANFLPGFSGGPVLDSGGNFIAIALGGFTGTDGYSVVLPEHRFRSIIKQLTRGKV